MRNLVLIAIMVCVAGACSTGRYSTPSPVGLVPLENYYVPLNNGMDTGYTYKVISSQAELDKTIKTSSTNSELRKPDFSGQTVVAVIHNTGPNRRKNIVMDGAAIGGAQMNVYYHVKGTVVSTVTTFNPGLGLATVPKASSVKQVSFYEDSVLVKTVPVSIY
jgi:hypothetical protein